MKRTFTAKYSWRGPFLLKTYPAMKYPDEVAIPHLTNIYTMYQLQIVREFDRINESPISKTILLTWEALVPVILELAANENCTSIDNMLDGVDHFSEGKYAHVNILLHLAMTVFTD